MKKIHPNFKILKEQKLSMFPVRYKSKKPDVDELKPILDNGYDGYVYSRQNIGIICGRHSGNLVCFDIEKKKRKDDDKKHYPVDISVLDKILPDCLNQTLTDKTGTGGLHLFLRSDNLPTKTTQLFFPIDNEWEYVIDIKVTGYVLGAGSVNDDGNEYRTISNTNSIKQVDFHEILTNLENAGFSPRVKDNLEMNSDQNKWTTEELLEGKFKRGERRRKENSLYIKMRRRQKTPKEAYKIIQEINEKLDEPLDNMELKQNLGQAESFFINEVFPKWGYCEDSTIYELKKLSDIGSPVYANKIVSVRAIIASNAISYNVPCSITVECQKQHNCVGTLNIPIDITKQVKFVEIHDTAKNKYLNSLAKQQFNGDCDIIIKETKSTTISKVRIKSTVSSLTKKDHQFFDDSGNEWVAYDVYLLHSDIPNLNAGTEVKINGIVTSDPKTSKVTMIISDISPADLAEFDFDKLNELRTLHKNKSIENSMKWWEEEFEKYSGIVKRYDVTRTGLISICSPLNIVFEGQQIPSWIKSLIIGDSTTGKSETIRKLIILSDAGQIISGEMSSVAGLAGASVQASGGQWFTDFGLLPLNDKKFLAIDGAHVLKSEELSKLAEAERNGTIEINKASKGKAYARTRQCKIMNPLDNDQQSTVSIGSFLYPVQSLKNALQLQNISRIDIACFVANDISPEERNISTNREYDHRIEHLSELIRLVWDQKYTIDFPDDTTKEILNQATILEKKFQCDEFPLVTNDQKIKLAKLSASIACLGISFDESFDKLMVLPEHVRYVSSIIDSEYTNAGLEKLSKKSQYGNISDSVLFELFEKIKKKTEINDTSDIINIITWMAEKGKFTSSEVGEQFALSRDSQTKPLLSLLQTENVIKRGKHRLTITKRGVEIVKFINSSSYSVSGSEGIGKNNIKKKESSVLERLELLERKASKLYRCKNCKTEWKATEHLSTVEKNHHKNYPSHKIEQIHQLCDQSSNSLNDSLCS